MSMVAAQIALMKRVATMSGAPEIVWPNGPGANLPRFVMQFAGGAQRTFGASRITRAEPEIMVRIETVADSYSTENDDFYELLLARFQIGDRFDGIEVIKAPSPAVEVPADAGIFARRVFITGFTSF